MVHFLIFFYSNDEGYTIVVQIVIPTDTAKFPVANDILYFTRTYLVDKPRLLAITKCDLVEKEWIDIIRPEIKVDVPFCFISSISGLGLVELKDLLWGMMNSDQP